jgi:hypothetical protein
MNWDSLVVKCVKQYEKRKRQRLWAARTIKILRMQLRMELKDRGVYP